MLIPWKSWSQSSAAKQIGCSKSWFRHQKPRHQSRWLKSDKRRRLRSGDIHLRTSPFASCIVAMLFVSGGVRAQYTNGGEVSMSCGDCECTGSSDDGEVEVFDNPSSGERTAYVAGEYSEILETSCGTSVIAAGDTLYELSGVDLTDRELHELSMSSSDCTTNSPGDCYSDTFSDSFEGGIDMSLDICVCLIGDEIYQVTPFSGMEQTLAFFVLNNLRFRSAYNAVLQTSIGIEASGTSSADVDAIEVCLQHGFVGYLVTAELGENSYRYKFDLVIPGHDSSADLSVASAPGSDAGAFMCGDVETDTSGSESETDTEMPAPTPEPPVSTPGPESLDPTLPPVGPEPTPSPIGLEPSSPPLSSHAPVPVPVPTPPEPEVEPETPLSTTSPSPPPDPQTTTESSSTTDSTTTSTTDGTQTTTPAPEPTEPAEPETDAPVNDPPVTDSPATGPPLEDNYSEEEITPAPVADAASTSAPTATQRPTPALTVSGSSDTPAPVEAPTRETPAPLTPTGVSNSSAPTVLTPSPSFANAEDSIISRFDDTGMNLSKGEGFAVAALGIFAVLTFLPAPNLY